MLPNPEQSDVAQVKKALDYWPLRRMQSRTGINRGRLDRLRKHPETVTVTELEALQRAGYLFFQVRATVRERY
jgi:hypothetical protein